MVRWNSTGIPRWNLAISIPLLLLLFIVAPLPGARASPVPLTKSQTGLVATDPLNTGSSSYWQFSGDAAQQNAPTSYFEDSQGLHIGVQAAAPGQWAGFFAKSPNTNAQVFHAILTLPYSSIPADVFNTGLYVQTSSGFVNYVACYAQVTSSGYFWSVLYSTGDSSSAQSFHQVYFQQGGPNVPLTRDCTIITNGSNVLEVYLDGQLVFSSSTLNLQMSAPFNAYLEVESTYASGMLFATYADYYATSSDVVAVQGGPSGGTVVMVDSNNNVLASVSIGSNGMAYATVGQYRMPFVGSIQVYDPNQNLVASALETAGIWGGDVYQVQNSAPVASPSTTSLTVNTQDAYGNTISGYDTLVYQNTNLIASGFSPSTFSLSPGATYLVQMANYGTCSFNHWSDTGNTGSQRTFVATSAGAQTLTAVYNCGSTGTSTPGGGTVTLTVVTLDTSDNQIHGMYVTLWQNGVQLQSCFSTCSFMVNGGQTYQIAVADYGSVVFSHWSDGTTTRYHTVSPGSVAAIALAAIYS
jgi:hypothetical protein